MTKINMVRREGGSRVLSVSRIIPLDWVAVEMEVTKAGKQTIVVRIDRVK